MRILYAGLKRRFIKPLFQRGFILVRAEGASSASELADYLETGYYDALVVDISTIEGGVWVPKELKKRSVCTPVIGVAERVSSTVFAQMHALFLENGGRHLLESPPYPRLLEAMLHASVRYVSDGSDRTLVFAHGSHTLTVDIPRSRIILDTREVSLTSVEWIVVESLARAGGVYLSKEALHKRIYIRPDQAPDAYIVAKFISNVRIKLNEAADGGSAFIQAKSRTGYRFSSLPKESSG